MIYYDTITGAKFDTDTQQQLKYVAVSRARENVYIVTDNKLNDPIVANNAETQSTKTINIYAGTNENRELSNFAIRPFTHEFSKGTYKQFQSVEQAFQYIKVHSYSDTRANDGSSTDGIALEAKIMNTTNGAQLRRLGRSAKKLNTQAWDRNSSSIMKQLITESFSQNPDALQKLLDTGNAILTHTQDGGKWGKEFPRILMEVRGQLQNEHKQVTIKNKISRSIDKYNRQQAINNPRTLYIFTDNTDRTSGGKVISDGWYKTKYGSGGFGSENNPTTAVLRGLDNAAPISTMKYFYRNHPNMSVNQARWTDNDFAVFKETIDDEIEDIKFLWDSGDFDNIIVPSGDGFFNSKIANISKQRTPKLYEYLRSKLIELSDYVNNVDENQQYIEQWSKKEGWSEEYFKSNVLPKILKMMTLIKQNLNQQKTKT